MAYWNVRKHGEKAIIEIFNGAPLDATELRDLAHELVGVAEQLEREADPDPRSPELRRRHEEAIRAANEVLADVRKK